LRLKVGRSTVYQFEVDSMKFMKTVLASAALLATFGASAQVTGSLGGGTGTFLSLSAPGLCAPCTLGPGVATIVGGTTYMADQPFADIPAGMVFQNRFLAAGPSPNTEPSTLTFTGAGVSYVSFLWGSPDTYNRLRVNTTGGFVDFTAMSLGFAVTNGNQSFSQYVQFQATGLNQITGLVFTNTPSINAFETANYSITPIPEPETYALMLAGLGALGFIARRRKRAA